uniref:IgGFc-binding protein N-terminal domain-containing protein n=1 Tax=Panagrolaimus sp. JU765 TaxID=591449 RepID=A0AC34PW27_9BILA
MAGTNYIVTLPMSYPTKIYDMAQFQVLYFIPATLDDYYNNTITVQMINAFREEKPVSETYNGLTYLYYFGWSRLHSTNQPTFYITSTKRIMVVAAVTCTPTSTGGSNGVCDYAAYMPPRSYTQDCSQYAYDLHAFDTTNAVNFYVAPPVWINCQTSPVNIASQYSYTQPCFDQINYINSVAFQAPLKLISDSSAAFRSDSALLQVTRLGGVDLEGHNSGAFLTHMPGIGSFVQGVQYFLIFSQDAHLEVVTTGTNVTVNGIKCDHRSVLPNPLGQWFYFLCNITGGPDVLHYVYSPTPFMATVIGHDDSGLPVAYGFEVAYNSPRIGAPYTISTTAIPTTTATKATTTPITDSTMTTTSCIDSTICC